MTDVWYDTEFIEDGRTIEPISIGMVAATNETEFETRYWINRDVDLGKIWASDWLRENVLPHLPVIFDESNGGYPMWDREHPDYQYVMPRSAIASQVFHFIGKLNEPRLISWYASYDHVLLSQLWGAMRFHPDEIPMWTYDLRQKQAELGVKDDELPAPQEGTEHNALADAQYHRQLDYYLQKVERLRTRHRGLVGH